MFLSNNNKTKLQWKSGDHKMEIYGEISKVRAAVKAWKKKD